MSEFPEDPVRRSTVEEWIAGRTPSTPDAFRDWMRPARGGAPAGVETLVAEARQALARASDAEGRPRDGAFDLLAADGFATWACEAAIESEEPAATLRAVVDALLE